jgi:adenylate cyclase class IV
MREIELKSVVDDLAVRRTCVERAGAELTFAGRLEDRRYDTAARELTARDLILRVREYRPANEPPRASLEWKGPMRREAGYKVREELSLGVASRATLEEMLAALGYEVSLAIDRDIAQYAVNGAVVRFEQYPRMDTLVEVEGAPDAIERAIAVLGLPRHGFNAESLFWFMRQFESRTGLRACLSDAGVAAESAGHASPAGAPAAAPAVTGEARRG